MPGRLTVFLPDRPALRLDVTESESDWVIGRGSDCDLQIDHPQFSRRHARLSRQNDSWLLEDLGSKNGVFVDGRRADRATIRDAGWLQFGDVVARLETLTAAALQREREQDRRRWETSLELRRQLDPGAGLEPLLDEVLRSVLNLSGTERGFVMLSTAGGDLEIKSARGAQPGEFGGREFSGSIGAIDLALSSGETIVCCDATTDAVLGTRASVIAGDIRALLSIPLVILDKTTGVLYADSRQPGKVFTDLDIDILQGMADHAAMAIAVARIRDDIAGLGGSPPVREPDYASPKAQDLKILAGRLPGYDPRLPARRRGGTGSDVTWSAIRQAHMEHRGPNR